VIQQYKQDFIRKRFLSVQHSGATSVLSGSPSLNSSCSFGRVACKKRRNMFSS
jgi:hypothetical protein